MRTLNILMTAMSLDYRIHGGLSRHTYELCKTLNKLGCHVYVSCMKNAVKEIDNKILVPSFPGTGFSFFDFLSFNANLPRKIRGYDIDLIHSQGDHGFVFALTKERPLVVTVHTSIKIGLRALTRARNHVAPYFRILTEKYTFMKADKIIAVSESLSKSIQNDYGVEKEKIVCIPNAVDINKFNPYLNGRAIRDKYGAEGPLLLCVTRLELGRFVEKLILMIKIVAKEFPNVKLIIVGDGPSRQSLEKLRASYGVTKNVILAGAMGDNELPYCYAAADVYVLPMVYTPARKEFSVLEAMASGKVVIYVNRIKPTNEEERICVGNPIAAKDDKDFASLIIYLLQDEKKRKQLGLVARKAIVESFSWEKIAEKTLEVYRLLV